MKLQVVLLRETADGTHNTTNAYKCYCSGPSSLWVCFATCSDAFDTCLDLSEPYVMSANMKGNASNHANCENPNYLYLEIFNFAEQVDLSSVAPRDGGCHKASYHIVLSSHRLSLDATITCNGSIGGIPPQCIERTVIQQWPGWKFLAHHIKSWQNLSESCACLMGSVESCNLWIRRKWRFHC